MNLDLLPSYAAEQWTNAADAAGWIGSVLLGSAAFYFLAPAFGLRDTRDSWIPLFWGITATLAASFGFYLGAAFAIAMNWLFLCHLPLNISRCGTGAVPVSADWVGAATAGIAALIVIASHFTSDRPDQR